jgi:hypothetical protein
VVDGNISLLERAGIILNVVTKPPATREPWHLEIPTHKDVFVGELVERGEWVVAKLEPSLWPVNAQKVIYRGHAIWIIPVMKDFYPAVAMKVPPGKSRFPEPTSDQALLALALMREGRGLNHPAYAFLSFFRVLEVAFPDGRTRQAWIATNVANIDGVGVKEAFDRLARAGITDVGAHLFELGRCAVAHASRQPIVDPDNPNDLRRLSSELPIITALARKAIEDELTVETSQTVYRKHLYELAGFKEILGPEIVGFLTRGEEVTEQRMLEIPHISVRIRRREPYAPLGNLVCRALGQDGKLCHMRFGSTEGDVIFQFALDFGNERLEFSVFHDVTVTDTGSAEAAERVAEVLRFQHDYFCNGQLHIVDAETGNLIGRKDAYLPVNMFFNPEAADAEVERWKVLAELRRYPRGRLCAEEMDAQLQGYDIKVTPSS